MSAVRIYYSCNQYPTYYIDCWCSRWDESNYDVIFETFLESGNRNTLFNNVVPGAVRELYNILGTPYFIDTTYASGNTIIISPRDGYGVSGVREERIVAVKNISDHFINTKNFSVKMECKKLKD
jgi:hypothetical protein